MDSPNSLLLSTDPVAIDSVMTDLLHAEGLGGGVEDWADDYLELAAGAGLGTYERGDPWSGSDGYGRIDLIYCEDSVCPGTSPHPSPTSSASPTGTETAKPPSTRTPTGTAVRTPTETRTPLTTTEFRPIYLPLFVKRFSG
jgi:hypothetical protein